MTRPSTLLGPKFVVVKVPGSDSSVKEPILHKITLQFRFNLRQLQQEEFGDGALIFGGLD